LAVNRELVELYWQIGRSIVERQQLEGWGRSVVQRLARDVQAAFPSISGFSPQNFWYMRALYVAWTEDVRNLQQPVGEIPWGHNLQLLAKLKDPVQRLWYAQQTVENGWSRAVLVHQIELNLYSRRGQAQTNFSRTLPAPQSDLAHQVLKDPYTFDFLALAEDVRERQLEQGLLDHMRKFLLELGTGFASQRRRCLST
jgi:predicted nuclease of restriction endonuclease-like (RecB) superfamily